MTQKTWLGPDTEPANLYVEFYPTRMRVRIGCSANDSEGFSLELTAAELAEYRSAKDEEVAGTLAGRDSPDVQLLDGQIYVILGSYLKSGVTLSCVVALSAWVLARRIVEDALLVAMGEQAFERVMHPAERNLAD